MPRQLRNSSSQIPDPATRPRGQSHGHNATLERTDDVRSGHIFSEAEVVEKVLQSKEYALKLVPIAIKVIAETLLADDPRLRFSAAIELCKIAGIPQSGGIQETAAEADQRREEKSLSVLGMIEETFMTKSEIYKMPLSKGFAQQAREFADRAAKIEREVGTEADEEAAFSKSRVRPAATSFHDKTCPERSAPRTANSSASLVGHH